jgi:hypothetical protein
LRHFCTLFNSAYQFHSQLLYESICENDNIDNLQFYFFCFDEDSFNYFKNLNLRNVNLISLEELENYLPELKEEKPKRSLAEYFFTSTPAICKYVLGNYSTVTEIVYLDADLFFFQSPEILFTEIGESSISIIPHRFNFLNYFRNIYGYYNVGWVSFKRDRNGIGCLNKWYKDNLKWCFDKLTFRKYADQKYLNYWTRDFSNVCVIKNKGANVAPWNVGNHKVVLRDVTICIDDIPLIFYHFASLKFIDNGYYTTVSSYFSFVTSEISRLIYYPYIIRLHKLGFMPRLSVRLNKNPIIRRMRKIVRHLCNDHIIIDD